MLQRCCVLMGVCLLMLGTTVSAADLSAGLSQGSVDLKSAGPLTFGPDGVLFVADPQAAAIHAIATNDSSENVERVEVNVDGLNQKIAAALGATARDILVSDLAVNPESGNVYLSVSRGRGPEAEAVLLRVAPSGELSAVDLKNVKTAKATLPNPPAAPAAQPQRQQQQRQAQGQQRRRGGRSRNQRAESITDLAYVDGRLLVAGLSSEEFASTLRSIPFPFQSVDKGTAVEIYHGNHGRFETRSPVRAFAIYDIDSQPHLVAGYTCTPLVKFPLSDLKPGEKIRGITVAELGNRNRPLDMFVYEQGGKDYILMANSARGVMKISTDGIDRKDGITESVEDTAGQTYDTITDMTGVLQLDRLNSSNALVLVQTDDGPMNLRTVPLP